MMLPVHKKLSEMPGLENFSKYAIDVEGTVWSFQYKWPKRLSPCISKNGYYFVYLKSDQKIPKVFYVHRLVSSAFIPVHEPHKKLIHKDGNKLNNRLENLEWRVSIKDIIETNDFILHSSLVERIKQVHLAAQLKGVKVGNEYDFTTTMIENAVNDYIMKYGLRKVMPDL
jgi:hypothetical protein